MLYSENWINTYQRFQPITNISFLCAYMHKMRVVMKVIKICNNIIKNMSQCGIHQRLVIIRHDSAVFVSFFNIECKKSNNAQTSAINCTGTSQRKLKFKNATDPFRIYRYDARKITTLAEIIPAFDGMNIDLTTL
jgi:hypothetical protein